MGRGGAPEYIYVARLYKKAFFVFDKKKRVGKPYPVHLIEEPITHVPTDTELWSQEEEFEDDEEDTLDEYEGDEDEPDDYEEDNSEEVDNENEEAVDQEQAGGSAVADLSDQRGS